MTYRLEIYTWPALGGVDCQCRTTNHDSPGEAVAHLDAETTPYSYAVLSKHHFFGWDPVGWHGEAVYSGQDWPKKMGANRGVTHPALVAYQEDKSWLIREIRRIQKKRGGGMIDIAHDLLQERHPKVGLADQLGWQAAGE